MAKYKLDFIASGSVTSPWGFSAGAVSTGVSSLPNKLDLGILRSQSPCTAAALFTKNRVQAAPVTLSRKRLGKGRAVALVASSGCANAFTGAPGLADAQEMAALVAGEYSLSPEDVLVASTGVIGTRLPMANIRDGIGRISLSRDGGHDLARAIMTTDTVPKEAALRAEGKFTIGGIAKGSGMIHPEMGTLLCFLTTDARVELGYLRWVLSRAVGISFNMISIDGDTSPNDTVLIMANGLASDVTITDGSPEAEMFKQGLEMVCLHLAREIARDGEGATRLIEFTVTGALSLAEAKLAARAVVSSPLVKTSIHGSDPNWGRILAAVGRSGATVEEKRVDLRVGDVYLIEGGTLLPFDRDSVVKYLKRDTVSITLNLNLGTSRATAWGCDLSEEYVTINSEYTS
jgi:glutamate N-acetyltransferase/amino-acid N-acetyltransferase